MQIRESTESDIPGILEVLKASLGETSSKKTEEVWRYKHIDNPFGESLVLVALEQDRIIGVRAFMRWQWQKENQIYSAFRAVDTATHPEHQGKGIFKKLTLRAWEIAKEQGDHFVFNTPNEQSKPGYLKMGWEEVDKLEIQLAPSNPLYWKFKAKAPNYKIHRNSNKENLKALLISAHNRKMGGGMFTPKTPEYLSWRFERNPLQQYHVLQEADYYIAGYVKQRSRLKEFRISERICGDKDSERKANKAIKNLANKFGAQIISCQSGTIPLSRFGLTSNFGPWLTLKNVNLSKKDYESYKQLRNWNYSIGDLELF
jgi:predicted N-acetyltransferase YhbS